MPTPEQIQEMTDFILQLRGMKLSRLGNEQQRQAYESALGQHQQATQVWDQQAADYSAALNQYRDVEMPAYEQMVADTAAANQAEEERFAAESDQYAQDMRDYTYGQMRQPNYLELRLGPGYSRNHYLYRQAIEDWNRFHDMDQPTAPAPLSRTSIPENPYTMPTNNPGAPPSFNFVMPESPYGQQLSRLGSIAKQRQMRPQQGVVAPQDRYSMAYAPYRR